jgi:hypothetical protein
MMRGVDAEVTVTPQPDGWLRLDLTRYTRRAGRPYTRSMVLSPDDAALVIAALGEHLAPVTTGRIPGR